MPDLHVISEETIKLAVELTQMHGFVCLPTADKVPLAKGWQQFGESYKGERWSLAKGVGIQTGSRSGITVVDIDEPDTEFFEKFMKHFDIKPTTWVVTPGNGYHLYFKYNGDLPNGNFEPIKWDIRNDGGYIMAPGSYYTNPKKPHMNFKKYTFKTLEDGTELDWEYIRDLDEEFLKVKLYGIDQETMKFGKKVLKKEYKSKEIVKKKETDDNKVLFMDLMMAYAKAKGTGYQEWLYGVWAICHVCKEFGWDPQKFAIAWSEEIEGYNGPANVIKKVNQHSLEKGSYTLQWILGQVSDEAREAFSAFERTYCYYDYTNIFRNIDYSQNAALVDINDVEKYIKTAFVRVDRKSMVLIFLRDTDGMWYHGKPFDGNPIAYCYKVPNPKFKPNDVKCKEQEFKFVRSSMKQTLINRWAWIPQYQDLQYMPFVGKNPVPHGTFNTFSGYRHEIYSADEYDPGQSAFLAVMHHWKYYMCNNNEEFFEYLMNWIAWQLRHGWKKIKTAIVMHGTQGIGKGVMFVEFLAKGIVGEQYVNVQSDLGSFMGRFNGQRMGKSFHILDECTSINSMKGQKISSDKLKAMITDEWFSCELKGKETFQARDCAGVIMLSNHKRCCDPENDDRRYAMIETSKNKPGAQYYKTLRTYINDTHVQRTFFTYLMKRDLSKFIYSKIPETKSRLESQGARGENRILDFLVELVTGILQFDDAVSEGKGVWFDAVKNETHLKVGHRWYGEQVVYNEFRAYLQRAGIAGRYWPSRPNLVSDLKAHGMKIRKVTCRAWKFAGQPSRQTTCMQIDKSIVKELVRHKRHLPDWEYPEE